MGQVTIVLPRGTERPVSQHFLLNSHGYGVHSIEYVPYYVQTKHLAVLLAAVGEWLWVNGRRIIISFQLVDRSLLVISS